MWRVSARSFCWVFLAYFAFSFRHVLAAEDPDTDGDGLSDRLELAFHTSSTVMDTDGDGFLDGVEVRSGYSPTSTTDVPLNKRIRISLKTQQLHQEIGGVSIADFSVSTGRPGKTTPIGSFKILSKNKRAWSHAAKLWMPWWMQFTRVGNGIHELPEWPGGKKEGANHLGTPVSGGCVRLGIGPAKALYDWAPIGTPVIVER